jgi:hypothetical protein
MQAPRRWIGQPIDYPQATHGIYFLTGSWTPIEGAPD